MTQLSPPLPLTHPGWQWSPSPRTPRPSLTGNPNAAVTFGIAENLDELQYISAMICQGIEDGPLLKADWSVPDPATCELKVESPRGRLLLSFRKTTDGLGIDFGLYQLPDDCQNHGLAKRMLKNLLLVCDELRVTHIGAYANFEVGGYSWAKYAGYPFEASSCRSALLQRLEKNDAAFSRDEAATLRDAIQKAPDERLCFDIAGCGKPKSLGKRLLMGFSWEAYWDLTDFSHRSLISGALK